MGKKKTSKGKKNKQQEEEEVEKVEQTNESTSESTTSVEASTSSQPTTTREVKDIIYCPICTLPIEYCEFTNQWDKCEKYLAEHYPAVRDELVQLRENDKNKNKKGLCTSYTFALINTHTANNNSQQEKIEG